MSTPTASNRLAKLSRGAQVGVWDGDENTNLDLIDAALDGMMTIDASSVPVVSGVCTYTLSEANYADDESRRRIINVINTPPAPLTVVTPAGVTKWYWLKNGTGGNIGIEVSGSGSLTVPPGLFAVVTDGTNFYSMTASGSNGENIPRVITSPYTAVLTDLGDILVLLTAGTIDLTPFNTVSQGKSVVIKAGAVAGVTVTLTGFSGAVTITLPAYGSFRATTTGAGNLVVTEQSPGVSATGA